MQYTLAQAIEILERTPRVLSALLGNLSDDWAKRNEGGESWSPYDVLGHLIHGERKDWVERMKRILESGVAKPFEPFDRFAMFEESKGKTTSDLLAEFSELRKANIAVLRQLYADDSVLELRGMHPALGEVSMRNLLSTWVVHDLGHLAQIARVMASQYESEVGPWKAYLPILTRK